MVRSKEDFRGWGAAEAGAAAARCTGSCLISCCTASRRHVRKMDTDQSGFFSFHGWLALATTVLWKGAMLEEAVRLSEHVRA